MEIRLAGFLEDSLVNGPGIRTVIFGQGCYHNCEGCFNKHTHNALQGEKVSVNKLINRILENPIINGVTFSGGDPFVQSIEFSYIGSAVKKERPDIDIWCYTGYTFEYLLEKATNNVGWSNLLNIIDVLVDGKFDVNKTEPKVKYRGSYNQRLIDVNKSLKHNKVYVIEDM